MNDLQLERVSKGETPLDPAVAAALESADLDTHEAFQERAAIMEFDGGMTRRDAERAAAAQFLSNL